MPFKPLTRSIFFIFYRWFWWLASAWTWQRSASPTPPSSPPSPSTTTERGRTSPSSTSSWMVTKSSHQWKTEQCNFKNSKKHFYFRSKIKNCILFSKLFWHTVKKFVLMIEKNSRLGVGCRLRICKDFEMTM